MSSSSSSSSSSHPSVLVTGATGSTGLEVVHALSASGKFNVIAAVRDVEKAKKQITDSGVSFVKLDDQPDSANSAFKGVDAAYILTAPKTATFDPWLKAAKAAGVKHIVYHSAAGTGPKATYFMAQEHFEHEEKLKASGLPYTIVRPTFFHQNLEKFHVPTITQYSMFAGSAGDGRFSSIDVRDLAAFAAALFAHPTDHQGRTYELTGVITTEPAIAEELSKVAGRPIHYVKWTVEEHRQKLTEWGLPQWLVEDQLELDAMKREERTANIDPALERVLGRKAITIEQYIQDKAELWKAKA